MGHRGKAVLLCLLSSALGCSRDHPEPSLLDWVDSPVPVKLILRSESEPNPLKLIAPDSEPLINKYENHLLVLETKPKTTIEISCAPIKAQVAVAKSLDRLAYRCDTTGPWKIQWLMPMARFESTFQVLASELGPKSPLISTDGLSRIDTSTIPSFAEAMPEWLVYHPAKTAQILEKTEQLGLSTKEVMARTVSIPPSQAPEAGKEVVKDAWLDHWAKLPVDQKMAANIALKQALFQKKPSPGTLLRALHIFEPSDTSLQSTWTERAWELSKNIPIQDTGWGNWIFDAILHRISPLDPKESGKIACAALSQSYIVRKTVAFLSIAHGKTPCPAVAEDLQKLEQGTPCKLDLACHGPGIGSHTCSDEELAREIERFFNAPMPIVYLGVQDTRALSIAGRFTDSIPQSFLLREARRHYVVEMPEQPPCQQVIKRGQACQCKALKSKDSDTLCELSPELSSGKSADCEFQVDDAKKRVFNVKQSCRTPTMICFSDEDCCKELQCRAGDGGVAFCGQ